MKFYGRNEEIEQLHDLSRKAYQGVSTMTLLVGRRRVGKTSLIKECFAKDPNFIYFFISRKAENLLCEELKAIISEKIATPRWAELSNFASMLEFIISQSTNNPLTLVLDEFQDLQYVNPTLFNSIQNVWDTHKKQSKIHFIACGSIYSIMCKIFENSKQPLFGRADTRINLNPLKIKYQRELLVDEKHYSAQNLLSLYTIAGGIPRYLELLHMQQAWSLDKILKAMLSDHSFFVYEGKDVLIDELGKDYKTYFSILSLIANGKTSRTSIESILQITVGGYLENLENELSIITRHRSIFSKESGRNIKYYIKDNFLNFWFRYFNKNQSAIEIGNYAYIIDLIKEDFASYSGKYLEKMARELLAESGEYNIIGSYWNKDSSNEIDVIACNERKKTMLIVDVKLQAKKLNLELLKHRANDIIGQHPDYDIQFKGFSLENLDNY